MIKLESKYKKRQPYPLGWDEQALLFPELAGHLQRMALFAVNTSARQEEVCGAEVAMGAACARARHADDPANRVCVTGFGDEERRATGPGAERCGPIGDRGGSPGTSAYVFTYKDRHEVRNRVGRMNNKGWRGGRRRAAERYKKVLERECPNGFKRIRVHDLRHTFGRRLRAAGVSLEDRQDLLGHKSSRMTTHYSAAEIGNLLITANLATKSREAPARTVLHVVGA
jgi:hypothetical protein